MKKTDQLFLSGSNIVDARGRVIRTITPDVRAAMLRVLALSEDQRNGKTAISAADVERINAEFAALDREETAEERAVRLREQAMRNFDTLQEERARAHEPMNTTLIPMSRFRLDE